MDENRPGNAETQKFFSVLIRTHARPKVLAQALACLQRQSYQNFEVVVVEDGPETARQTIEENFKGLNIVYRATQKPVGRCAAGNLAASLSSSQWCMFFDDDDEVLENYLATFAKLVEENPAVKLFSAGAFAAECQPLNIENPAWQITDERPLINARLTFADMCADNRVPIQAVCFHRSLFEAHGGLDEALPTLEDWDLWIRYLCHAKMVCTQEVTSRFRLPADPVEKAKRHYTIMQSRPLINQKMQGYLRETSAFDIFCAAGAQQKEKELEQIYKDAEEYRRAAQAILQSRRWKLAAPLRALGRWFVQIGEAMNPLVKVQNPGVLPKFDSVEEYARFVQAAAPDKKA